MFHDIDQTAFTATYSPEDDKLRIYAAVRFDQACAANSVLQCREDSASSEA